jgi:hypothetical protein
VAQYATFQQYFSYIMATSFKWWKKPEYPERTTDHGQATGKLYHLRLRVECTLFCNLQNRAIKSDFYDIAEILLMLALNTNQSINQSNLHLNIKVL